uniref:Uncharacterized protein n=1 Tax=Phanerochaete carnosa TaxID=231932 RepID=A0A895KWN3_9APHY|nr:hypothetical protein K8K84_mgp094 [Phanerochaete carnosa]QRZ60358.1 hypothetical protein [Phanerochaete carnosa]
MLSLKALQAELEQLKYYNKLNSQSSQTVTTEAKGKQNVVTRFYTRSSMGLLWVISLIIGYAHKIPFISKIITALALWYGRTTWCQMLIKIRKAFVVFNAIIGVLAVFKKQVLAI